jgi:hypothetical protein
VITCEGMRCNRYLIWESEPNVKLNFIGVDASHFEQVDAPTGEHIEIVNFDLPVEYLRAEVPGFLPERVQ